MNNKTKTALVYNLTNTFVQQDIQHLQNLSAQVYLHSSYPHKDPIRFWRNRLRELFFGLFYGPRVKVVFCWFNDYHAFFPLLWARLLAKKGVLIVGGYDAVSDPALQYGVFAKNNGRQWIAKWNYKLAHLIWVVDETLANGCENAQAQEQIQSGIKHFLPTISTPIEVVPTGYDPDFWKSTGDQKPHTILTVANIPDKRTFRRKGIDLFFRLAQDLPHFKFTLAGLTYALPKTIEVPQNVTLLGRQNANELRALYAKHYYYFQGSRVEGLPNVLCEAMLCECIPLVRNVFGMPKAVGETGFVFNPNKDWEKLLQFVANDEPKEGNKARERILKQFHIQARYEAFKLLLTQSS